ncbi:MAG: hypothetical protein ACREK4_10550, partial [Candidatus Rokuibacteriota bacterium]
MLAQADFQRTLALALGELAPAWTIVGECAPVDRFDASHWGSGPLSFQVTVRHRVTGHMKVLGRRTAYEPGATVHPAVALPLIGAYRHGNSEPLRVYLEEIGVAAVIAGDGTRFFHRPPSTPSPRSAMAEPPEILAAGLAVAAPVTTASTTSLVGEIDGPEPEIEDAPRRPTGPRSWSLRPKWPALLTRGSRAPREEIPAPLPRLRRKVYAPPPAEARRPMLGRLRRELQIWYWRRVAS